MTIVQGAYAECAGCAYREILVAGGTDYPVRWPAILDVSGTRHYCSYACLVRAAGDAKPRISIPVPARLALRDVQILEQIAIGLSNQEVGDALGLSEPTIKNHMFNICQRLHAQSRTQAVLVAYRFGILNLEQLSQRCAERLGYAA